MNENGERGPRWLELAFEHWEVSAVFLIAGLAYVIHLAIEALL